MGQSVSASTPPDELCALVKELVGEGFAQYEEALKAESIGGAFVLSLESKEQVGEVLRDLGVVDAAHVAKLQDELLQIIERHAAAAALLPPPPANVNSASPPAAVPPLQPPQQTDSNSVSRLFKAIEDGDMPGVSLIVQQFSNESSVLDCRNAEGLTPLIAACKRGHTEACSLLATAPGVSINARDPHGGSALMHAASAGRSHIQCLRTLLMQPSIDIHAKAGSTHPTLGLPADVERAIIAAINFGAPAYNNGDIKGCAEEYLVVSTRILSNGNVSGHPRATLAASVLAAAGHSAQDQTVDQQAWTLRRGFDATLARLRRPEGGEEQEEEEEEEQDEEEEEEEEVELGEDVEDEEE